MRRLILLFSILLIATNCYAVRLPEINRLDRTVSFQEVDGEPNIIDPVKIVVSPDTLITTNGIVSMDIVNRTALGNTESTTAGCSLVGIPIIDGATYTAQCDFNKLFGSAGRASGGVISDNGDDTVSVTAGTGFIKATDDDTAELLSFDWDANNSVAISNNITWIGVRYNIGSPEVFQDTSIYNFDLDTEFPLGVVYRETVNGSYNYCIMNSPWWVTDGTTNIIERIYSLGKVYWDKALGGMIISNPSGTKLAITTGKIWSLLTEFDMTAIDTSVPTGSFWYMWYHSTNGWQLDDTATDYSVAQWNDTTKTSLQNLSNNWYANIWVYACAGIDKFVLLYPQNQYSNVATAEAEAPPTLVPVPLVEEGILIGRLLIKQGVDAPIEIQSTQDAVFTAAQAADHGNLSGLNDDDHTQYLLANGTRALAGAWDMGNYALSNVNIDSGDINTAVTQTEWDTAYTHSQDNTQAHTDYLINNGDDTTSGRLTMSELVVDTDTLVVNLDSYTDRVGIRTAIPQYGALEVKPTANDAGTGITLYSGSGSTCRSWIDSSGNWQMTRGTTPNQGIAINTSGNVTIGETTILNDYPQFNFDTQDYYYYDKTNNEHEFYIANNYIAGINSTGINKGTHHVFTWNIPGVASTHTNTYGSALIVPFACTIVKARINAATNEPVDADLIVDINYDSNGGSVAGASTIWSTQANRLKIADGSWTGNTTTFNTTSLAAGGTLYCDVDQVGSTDAGEDISVQLIVVKTGAY